MPTQVHQLTPQQQQQHQQQQQQIARLALIQQQQQQNATNARLSGAKTVFQGISDQTKTLLTRPALLTMPTPSGTIAPPIGAFMSTTNATSNGLIGQLASASALHKGEKRKYEAMR